MSSTFGDRPIINVEESHGYLWDTGTLAWIPAEPATGGPGGSATEYTEDAAAAANPTGVVTILVRKDTPASEVTTDGDNIAARGSAYGAQYVTLLDTGGSPVAVGGGTQYTEDAAAAANPTGTALIMVRADALAALTTTDGDNVAARGTDKGELYIKHVDPIPVTQSGVWDEVGINDSGNSITVDNATLSVVGGGAEATALRVTIASDSTGVLSVDDNGATISVDDAAGSLTVDNATLSVVGSGVEATALRVTIASDSTGVISVDDNGGSLTVDGTVTANAGTNLNTSALALEVGGNLAGAATSLAVIDDWDETDRAKVNIIVGQAGVAADAGAPSATTPRVVESRGDTGTTSSVAGSATSVTLLAANANRLTAIIHNDSTAVLKIKYGITASASDYTYKVGADAHAIIDDYNGRLDGIWAAANGNARITEVT